MVVKYGGRVNGNCPLGEIPSAPKAAATRNCSFDCAFSKQPRIMKKNSNNNGTKAVYSLPRKKVLDTCLPNLYQASREESGLRRYRRVYLRVNEEIDRVREGSKGALQVELPGIGTRKRGKSHGKICVHQKETVESLTTGKRETGGGSPFGGYSSSETGSESWTSGNGGSSPRRKIRVPTPMTNLHVSNRDQSSPQSVLNRVPHPPSAPRRNVKNAEHVETNDQCNTQHELILSDTNDDTDDVQEIYFRPKTPALRKSKHFKMTLQNIQELCITDSSDDGANSNKPISKKWVTSISPRRRSVGDVENHNDGDQPDELLRNRRMSMPLDLHELRKGIEGVRFINVRELSREYIEELLSQREAETDSEVVGDDRRQQKCLSWLHSLEQSG